MWACTVFRGSCSRATESINSKCWGSRPLNHQHRTQSAAFCSRSPWWHSWWEDVEMSVMIACDWAEGERQMERETVSTSANKKINRISEKKKKEKRVDTQIRNQGGEITMKWIGDGKQLIGMDKPIRHRTGEGNESESSFFLISCQVCWINYSNMSR